MSESLKADLDRFLGAAEKDGPMPVTMCARDLRTRLAVAQVAEPIGGDGPFSGLTVLTSEHLARIEERLAALDQRMDRVERRAFDLPDHIALGDCAAPAPKADAELLAELRAELGPKWTAHGLDSGASREATVEGFHVFYMNAIPGTWVWLRALRKHGAPVVAGWLRGLAGVDA